MKKSGFPSFKGRSPSRALKGRSEGKDIRVGIVVSRFNEAVTEDLLRGALVALEGSGVRGDQIEIFRVPGAFEIPMTVKAMAKTGRFDGLVALGAVIRGETPHFDYISSWVSRGIGQVTLDTGTPVGFGVLTTDTVQQAVERADPDKFNRGGEAALSVLEMASLVRRIK